MVRMFRTSDGAIHEIQEPQDGCWVALTNPTATEIFEISEQFQIEVDDLRAPLDEPTRGIDVGAKYEIYQIMIDLAKQGKGIIMISSEMPELIGMSNRILVMCNGHITGEVQGEEATQERIMSYATKF